MHSTGTCGAAPDGELNARAQTSMREHSKCRARPGQTHGTTTPPTGRTQRSRRHGRNQTVVSVRERPGAVRPAPQVPAQVTCMEVLLSAATTAPAPTSEAQVCKQLACAVHLVLRTERQHRRLHSQMLTPQRASTRDAASAHLAIDDRRLCIGRLCHAELARLVRDKPRPAGAELRRAGRLELLRKLVVRAKRVVNGLGHLAAGLAAAARAHALPEKRVVYGARAPAQRRHVRAASTCSMLRSCQRTAKERQEGGAPW